MKTTHLPLIALCILIASLTSSFAIEGIQVSIQSSNVVLSWPSLTNETYIAQYRHTLQSTDSWSTLTNYFPASQTTNITYFVHSNSVDFGTPPSGGGTNSGTGVPNPGGTNDYSGPPGTNGIAGTGFYRVVRDGVHMWGITNGMVVSNVLVTSIELAVDTTDEVVGVSFYDTNTLSPIIGASAQNVGGHQWLLTWNTTHSYNGEYAVCAQVDFATTNSVMSQPVDITVDNAISFPNYFSQVYGDQMWIYAVTFPDAAYTLDMYDDNTNYLGTFGGNADDTGTISFLWNFVDDSGDTSSSTNFFGVYTVDTSGEPEVVSKATPHAAKSATFLASTPANKTMFNKFNGPHPNGDSTAVTANQLWAQEGSWTPNNYWVLAYAPLTDPVTDPNTSYRESLMMLGGADDEDLGVIGALDANGAHGNLSPGNFPETSAFQLGDATSRANLLSYLSSYAPHYENFYYFGHGNNSAISAYNVANTAITSDQIAYALGNVPLVMNDGDPVFDGWDPDVPTMVQPTMVPSILHAALHPYRLVFLDGCDTGAGTFCEAFGIPAVTAGTNFFASAGVESRAFIGFTDEKSFNTSTWDSYSLMMGGFFEDWLGGLPVENCIGNAQNNVYTSVVSMDSSAIVFGAVDMVHNTRTRP